MNCPKCNNPDAECIIGNYWNCSVCDLKDSELTTVYFPIDHQIINQYPNTLERPILHYFIEHWQARKAMEAVCKKNGNYNVSLAKGKLSREELRSAIHDITEGIEYNYLELDRNLDYTVLL